MAAQVAPIPAAEPPVDPGLPKPERRALGLGRWLVATVLFAAVFGARFLVSGFDNDHFRMITQGRQVLRFGELPHRDFVDPGIFLQIFTSAALQHLSGDNLVGQALFDLAVLGLAAALTFLLASHAAGSAALGLLTTLLAVAMLPRLKQHQVVFLPLLGLLLCWRYLERPSLPRLVALGLGGALAFLIRHDQGVYLAVPAAVALAAAHRADGWRVLLGRAALCAGVAGLALAPFFLFLQANGGIAGYFRSASEYIRSEADRQGPLRLHQFRVDQWLRVEAPPPPPPGQIEVRWERRLPEERRAELERRYRLANSRQSRRDADTWRYDIVDYSPGNLRALARDGDVEQVYGIDREAYRLDNVPEEPLLIGWWRAFPLLGVRLSHGPVQPANAVPWLFYVFVALPALALLALAARRLGGRPAAERPAHEGPKILAAALLCLAIVPALREPLDDRLADIAAVPAILGAWLLARCLGAWAPRRSVGGPDRRVGRRARWAAIQRAVRVALAATLVALTALSVASLPDFGKHRERLQVALSRPDRLGGHVHRVLETLRAPGTREAPGLNDDLFALVRYVRACTAPSDRLLVTWFAPEIYFYTGRGFAGRQIFWFQGFYSSPEDQERILDSLRAHPTPVAIHRTRRGNSVIAFDRVQAYLTQHYRLVHRLAPERDSDSEYQVLVESRREPTGSYDSLPLPCYA